MWYGFLLTENGASPSPKKIQALRSAPRPISAEGVVSFLCTVGFNSRFILRFAEHSLPLRKLSLSKAEFRWTDVHDEAFNYLKNALCTNTLNNTFVKNRPTGLFCDAGKKQHTKDTPGALSAVLAQKDSDSNWIPIQFVSRVLSNVETRYSQTELESLSILYGCKRLDFYLWGARGIEIYTDHLPLVTMYNKHLKTTPTRILRHVLGIQELDYHVYYKRGKVNISDFLSRNPPDPDPDSEDQTLDLKLSDDLEKIVIKKVYTRYNPITMNTIREYTVNCPDLQFLMECIRKRNWKQHIRDHRIKLFKSFIHEISEIDNIVFNPILPGGGPLWPPLPYIHLLLPCGQG